MEVAMGRVLFIYHSNFTNLNCGINSYLNGLFTIIKKMGYDVDLFIANPIDTDFSMKNAVISKCFLPEEQQLPKQHFAKKLVSRLKKYLNKTHTAEIDYSNTSDMNWVSDKDLERLSIILDSKPYSHIFFSYAFYTQLVRVIPKKMKTVLLLNDLLSVQMMTWQGGGIQTFQRYIATEIESVISFDRIVAISTEEIGFFKNFTSASNFYYLPHFLNSKSSSSKLKPIDIAYIGSDNPHNVQGINWFLTKIYPKIEQKKYAVSICGSVVKKIDKSKYPSIHFTEWVKDQSELLNHAKISICPILSGTGMKIKVIESLAYGLPVVSTSYGTIGMPQKFDNGCLVSDTADGFTNSIIELLENKSLREKLSSEALNQHKRYFSVASATKVIADVLKNS